MKRLILLILQIFIYSLVNAQGVRYTSTSLKMHKGANMSSNVVSVIPKGTSVTIEEDCDCKWIPVRYKGNIGYVSSKYLVKHQVKTSDHRSYKTSKRHYYTNSYGRKVQRPTYHDSRPAGATALCNDGTYSYSQHRRGTCSHHGGVSEWY